MPVKISDLTLPKDKLEKEYQVVNVSRWQRDGEILGWSYECVLPKLRFEKISVKVRSELPAITKEELDEHGIATITFANLLVSPWGRANGQLVSYGLSATADSATLMNKKLTNPQSNNSNN
ncbi:hypothetical protein FQS90_09855 [Enterococcus casseliflavus]|uniref:hypothetical protein n=1 Tax=unclassified Enterococcus TaxID=2608891 RepID=UPI000B3E466A|nr:hypothetical protein [Enterococcus sp. 8E11_MSG4843]MBO1096827.1 hypothetical protein [Enterococcus casseliflavus]MBO1145149.1 hypothetical protein [Enterococcus casseliflavus]OUZ36709.1 hypothetical protein A5885_000897 [Enterococcus sp. 8E11_MSG4843]